MINLLLINIKSILLDRETMFKQYYICSIYHNQSINNLVARSIVHRNFLILRLLIKYVFALSYIMICHSGFQFSP